MSVDLHLHTHYSDGNWSPSQLVEHAKKIKLRHIAITDHDTVAGIAEAQAAARDDLEIIPAIEVNTIWNGQDIHILGYFIDVRSASLLRLLQRQLRAREEHALLCVKRISDSGVNITLDLVQKYAGRGAIGKMHLTQALIATGAARDASEAYAKYLTRGTEFYIERKSVTPHDAIRAIAESGGISSIAHPGKEEIFELILELKQHGLKGVEAHHRIHSADRIRNYRRFAARNELLVTGGSDCHGPFEEYAATAGTVHVPEEVLPSIRNALSNAQV